MIKTISLIAQGGFALGIFSAEQQLIITSIIDDILSISIIFALVNLAIFFPAVFRGFHRKIAANRANIEWKTLCNVSYVAVMAAEQSIDGNNRQLKYDFVLRAISDYCKHSGSPNPSDDIKRILIESALYQLRHNTNATEVNYDNAVEC